MTFSNLLLISATVCTALMAGLFFSFSCAVVLGLKTIPNNEYIMAMQAINRAIQNPLFFIAFFGCLILLPVCCYLNYSAPISIAFWLLFSATVVYFVGAFGITVMGNIPLNNALDKFNLLTATKEVISNQRAVFENRWNILNNIRTISSILSLILLVIACLNLSKK
jgi:uncharacterized membrane protein